MPAEGKVILQPLLLAISLSSSITSSICLKAQYSVFRVEGSAGNCWGNDRREKSTRTTVCHVKSSINQTPHTLNSQDLSAPQTLSLRIPSPTVLSGPAREWVSVHRHDQQQEAGIAQKLAHFGACQIPFPALSLTAPEKSKERKEGL